MWSIGIYRGNSPFSLTPHPEINNPVIHPHDITDMNGVSIADPFMIEHANNWHMFFEILDGDSQKGCIGVATSGDALDWRYERVVLDEPFHLSYPYVFSHQGEFYMIPETVEGGGISLYKAHDFPSDWRLEGILVAGAWADPSIFQFDGRWWMFACSNPKESNNLHLFHSESLLGPWQEHTLSPLISEDNHTARPAGRVTIFDNKVIRFSQDCEPHYGTRVRAFEITKLSLSEYKEKEHELSPILNPTGEGWNSERMHHVDPHIIWPNEWIACVDGLTPSEF